MISSEIAVVASTSRIIATRTLLLAEAEDEPRSRAEFPDLRRIAAASTVTLGRAS